MGLGTIILIVIAVSIAFCLHIGVNIINRVLGECFLCELCDKNVLNCSFLVLFILFILLTLKPCHFAKYSRILVSGELLLQVIYLFLFCKLHYLILSDIFPFLCSSWIGCFPVWKVCLVLLLVWILWFYFLPSFHCKIVWKPDNDCGCSEADKTTVVSSSASNCSWCNIIAPSAGSGPCKSAGARGDC